jgi:hypothetical protein
MRERGGSWPVGAGVGEDRGDTYMDPVCARNVGRKCGVAGAMHGSTLRSRRRSRTAERTENISPAQTRRETQGQTQTSNVYSCNV